MNHALELLVLRRYGEEKWAEIKYVKTTDYIVVEPRYLKQPKEVKFDRDSDSLIGIAVDPG